MTKTEEAAQLINSAMTLLLTARDHLISVRSEYRYSLAVPIVNLQELHAKLVDSEGVESE